MASLIQSAQVLYPKSDIVLTGSGTEGLFRIFSLLRKHSAREFVLLSAYTCPDIAAAIVRAGFRLALLDVHPRSLAANPSSSSVDFKTCAAVVLSNLYGVPENFDVWRQLGEENDFLIIDDACQGALSADADGRVGERAGSIGVISFGRGKALSAIGGGALILPKVGVSLPGCRAELIEQLHAKPALALDASIGALPLEFSKALLMNIFGKPSLYWIPNSLPFLGLGETKCDLEFSLCAKGKFAEGAAWARLRAFDQFVLEQKLCADNWSAELKESYKILTESKAREASSVLIRYPIWCESVTKKRGLLAKLHARGLGASGSYPSTLRGFNQLSALAICGPLQEARKLAERIITLPVHKDVSSADHERVVKILGEI